MQNNPPNKDNYQKWIKYKWNDFPKSLEGLQENNEWATFSEEDTPGEVGGIWSYFSKDCGAGPSLTATELHGSITGTTALERVWSSKLGNITYPLPQ